MISEYYTAKGSRSFYKGTSFRCTKWDINTHYFNNEDFIDFVSYNGCLLKCNRSHISSTENEPLLTIRDGIIVGKFLIMGICNGGSCSYNRNKYGI